MCQFQKIDEKTDEFVRMTISYARFVFMAIQGNLWRLLKAYMKENISLKRT